MFASVKHQGDGRGEWPGLAWGGEVMLCEEKGEG